VNCRLAVAAATFVSLAYAQTDPKALVKQSVENYERDWREALAWCYTQTDITHSDDHDVTAVSEFAPLHGTPFERLISKNGQPLSPDEQRKEDRKYRKAAEARLKESPSEREARLAKYEKERMFIREIPEAYDFTLLGEETVDGRPAWVISLKPHPGFIPQTAHAGLLKHIEGKLWIDKENLQWAKAAANVRDTMSFGVILARIGPGTHFAVEQTRISDNFWMPKQIRISGEAKVLLVHDKSIDENLAYSGYRRESPAVSDAAKRPSSTLQPTYPKTQQDALVQDAAHQPVRSSSLQ
jgi:hypothetical protein